MTSVPCITRRSYMCEPSHRQRVLANVGKRGTANARSISRACFLNQGKKRFRQVASCEGEAWHGVNTILVDQDIKGRILILWGALAAEGWLVLFKTGG